VALERLLQDLERGEVFALHLEAAAEFADSRLCEPLRKLLAQHTGNPELAEAIRSCCG
jgi:hypothetical protein